MGALKKRKVARINSQYMEQHEANKVSSARRKKLLIRRLTFFSIFAVILSYLMISTLVSQSAAMEKMGKESERVEQELAEMKRKETTLREEIVKLNDDEYIGKLLRKEYFYSDEGEIIFTVPEEKKEKSSDKEDH